MTGVKRGVNPLNEIKSILNKIWGISPKKNFWEKFLLIHKGGKITKKNSGKIFRKSGYL